MRESAEDASDQFHLVAALHLLPRVKGGEDPLEARLTHEPNYIALCGSEADSEGLKDKLLMNERRVRMQGYLRTSLFLTILLRQRGRECCMMYYISKGCMSTFVCTLEHGEEVYISNDTLCLLQKIMWGIHISSVLCKHCTIYRFWYHGTGLGRQQNTLTRCCLCTVTKTPFFQV